MSVAIRNLNGLASAPVAHPALMLPPIPRSVTYQDGAGAIGRRLYPAFVFSLLVHALLLWQSGDGRPGVTPMSDSSPNSLNISMAIAPSISGENSKAQPEQKTADTIVRAAQPAEPVLARKTFERPAPPPVEAVAEPAPDALTTASTTSEPVSPVSPVNQAQSSTTVYSTSTSAEPMLGTGEAALPLITEPRFRRPPQPAAYPPQSVRRNEAGTALIRARISSLGDVVEANVFQSSGYALLDKSAIAAVRRWMFVPEQRGGHASEAWVQIPVHFRLQD